MADGGAAAQPDPGLTRKEKFALVAEWVYDDAVARFGEAPSQEELKRFIERHRACTGIEVATLVVGAAVLLLQLWEKRPEGWKRTARCKHPSKDFSDKQCGQPFLVGLHNGKLLCVDGHPTSI